MTTQSTTQTLQQALARHQQTHAAFEAARNRVQRLQSELATQQTGLEAAKSAARIARSCTADILREDEHTLKQIRDVKTKERAAHTLIADHEFIIAEVQLALDEALLEASTAQSDEEAAHAHILAVRADELLAALNHDLEPLYRVISALGNSYRSSANLGSSMWQYEGFESSTEAALSKVLSVVRAGYPSNRDQYVDDVIGTIQRPAGREFARVSPASMQRKRAELAHRRSQLHSIESPI